MREKYFVTLSRGENAKRARPLLATGEPAIVAPVVRALRVLLSPDDADYPQEEPEEADDSDGDEDDE